MTKADELMALTPSELALDVIAAFRDNPNQIVARTERDASGRYAIHRAAEVRAWEMSKENGGMDTAVGRHLAKTAGAISDLFHDVRWNKDRHEHVPVLG